MREADRVAVALQFADFPAAISACEEGLALNSLRGETRKSFETKLHEAKIFFDKVSSAKDELEHYTDLFCICFTQL